MDQQSLVDKELNQLNDQLLIMGGCAEGAIDQAIEALLSRNVAHCKRVYELESRINKAHLDVDDICWKMLARKSPVAQNLREVIATIKINSDLERLGDQATNIARNVEDFLKKKEIQIPKELKDMAGEVKTMVRLSLNCLVAKSQNLAIDVIKRDDTVDEMKRNIINQLVRQMKAEPQTIDEALTLIMVTKNLERMGDHATNIVEDVIFILTGKDVRHHNQKPEGTR